MKKYISTLIFAICLICSGMSFGADAQETKPVTGSATVLIEGSVYDDATGNPIPGATITMGEISVYSKEDGSFQLKIKQPQSMMTVTAPGYERRDFERRGRMNVRIALSSDFFNTPLGARPKVALEDPAISQKGMAINTIEDIDLLTPQQTVDQVIQSRMGNIRTISRSGRDGIGSAMYIRGLNSLNSSSQPLVILDGVIMETYLDITSINDGFFANPLAHIDLKDVESVTVVKDATSLYGAKAANGVILIETKRGHSMVTKILANVAMGNTMQSKSIPVLEADQNRILMSELYRGNSKYSPTDLDDMDFFNDDPTYLYYPQNHNQTNWKDWVYQNGFNQSYSMQATGGDAVGMYSLSVGYANNTGVIQNTGMSHLNSRFNSDIKIGKQIAMAVDFSISSLDYDLKNDGMLSATSPTYIASVKSPAFYPYSYSRLNGEITTNLQDYDALGINNPVPIIEMAEQSSKQTNFVASAKPVWTINKHWKWSALAAYGMDKLYESYFTPMTGVIPTVSLIDGGFLQIKENEARGQSMKNIRSTLESRISYTKDWDANKLSALFGFRYYNVLQQLAYVGGYNTGEDDQTEVSSSLKYKMLTGEDRKVKDLSWYMHANWNSADKYFLAATATMETSSRFGTEIQGGAIDLFGVNWGLFPSVSGAWLMSSEDFMAGANSLDMFKLRASYGITGNDVIDDYVANTYFSSQNFLSTATGLVLANLGNPALKWETTKKANVGVDIAMFNNRLSLSGDLYSHHTSDLLVLKNLESPLAGIKTYWANDGALSNKGYELSVNGRLVNTKNFFWEATASVAHYQNKVLSLADGDYTTGIYDGEVLTSVGNPISLFYGYQFDGVFSSKDAAATAHTNEDGTKTPLYNLNANTSLTAFEAGDAIFEDLNNDGIISEKDKQVIGNPNPDFTGIFSTTFGFKGISLSALFTYSYGNDVYDYNRQVLESMNTFNNQSLAVLNRWRVDGQVTDIPRASYGDPMGNARFSSRWIEDGSYLRLKSLTLSWNVPYKIPFLEGLNVWASANNLWIWTPYLGTDPETSVSNNVMYQGIDTGLTPQCTSFTVGLKLNL